MRAAATGPTSIRVTWRPSRSATGYMISYTSRCGRDSDSVSLNSLTYQLTDLQSGDMYTISVVATSAGLSSDSVVATDITLGTCIYNIAH